MNQGIPISDFEQFVDEKLLARGLSYFENGKVTSFEELSPGEFEAEVAGTEDYDVRITVSRRRSASTSLQ